MAGLMNCRLILNKKPTFLATFNGQIKDILRFKSNGKKSRRPPPRIKDKFEWSQESLRHRGFLRPLKPYQPPSDVSDKLDVICKNHGLSSDDSTKINNLHEKFNILNDCISQFNCAIPNSLLYTIETIGDLREFYNTPIVTTLPLDAARDTDLPPNLHIQYDYARFHPETDEKFNGKTAFPKSSTLVTGLKYKKMYKGHTQKNPFHDT